MRLSYKTYKMQKIDLQVENVEANPFFATKELFYMQMDDIHACLTARVKESAPNVESIDALEAIRFLDGGGARVKLTGRVEKKYISHAENVPSPFNRHAYELLRSWTDDPDEGSEGGDGWGGYFTRENYFAQWINSFDRVSMLISNDFVLTLYPLRRNATQTLLIANALSEDEQRTALMTITKKGADFVPDLIARRQNYHAGIYMECETVREYVDRCHTKPPPGTSHVFSVHFGECTYRAYLTKKQRSNNMCLFGGDRFVWHLDHFFFFTKQCLLSHLFTNS